MYAEECNNKLDKEQNMGKILGYDTGALVVSSLETGDSWVMDLGYSYHMFLTKEYFEILKMEKGGVVLFGANKTYKVYSIDTIILKMFDDHEFLLHNVSYILELRYFFYP